MYCGMPSIAPDIFVTIRGVLACPLTRRDFNEDLIRGVKVKAFLRELKRVLPSLFALSALRRIVVSLAGQPQRKKQRDAIRGGSHLNG